MNFLLIGIFVLGYAFIAFESPLKINKAAIVLLTAGILWTLLSFSHSGHETTLHALDRWTHNNAKHYF